MAEQHSQTPYENIFIPENLQILGCRFLDALVLVLIRGFLLYSVYSVKLSTILQSTWSWQTRDFNMALNAKARATEQMTISLLIYMNYEPKLKEQEPSGHLTSASKV